MTDVIGTATVKVTTDATGVTGPGLATSMSKAGSSAAGRFRSSFLSGMKGLVAATGITLGVGAAIGFFKSAVTESSNLAESTSKTTVVFGKQSDAIMKTAKTAASAMGLSRQAYLEQTATLGNLFTALKLQPKASADMSQGLVKLAADLASFNNVPIEDAFLAIRAGLVGETEPLRRFGVNMNEATLKTEAARIGLEGIGEVLTPQQKALAAYSLIMAQTGTAQGDFARTSEGLANQQRILGARFTNLKAQIGNELRPVMIDFVGLLSNRVVPWVGNFVREMRQGKGAGGDFADFLGDIGGAAKAAWPVLKQVFTWTVNLVGYMASHRKVLAVFVGTLLLLKGLKVSSSILSGLNLGRTALTGLGGTVATRAAPVPVFVTNPGFGGPGGGGGGKTPPVVAGKTGGPGLLRLVGGLAFEGIAAALVQKTGDEMLKATWTEAVGKTWGTRIGTVLSDTVGGLAPGGLPGGRSLADSFEVPKRVIDGWSLLRHGQEAATSQWKQYAQDARAAQGVSDQATNDIGLGWFRVSSRIGKASQQLELTGPAAQQARGVAVNAIQSMSHSVDGLAGHADGASHRIAGIGPAARASANIAIGALRDIVANLNAIHDRRFTVTANGARALDLLRTMRYELDQLHDKTIIVRAIGGHTVPGAQTGMVVRRPTIMLAGEAGPEVVVPLTKPVSQWAPGVADALSRAGRPHGIPDTVILRVPGADFRAYIETVADRRVAAADSLAGARR